MCNYEFEQKQYQLFLRDNAFDNYGEDEDYMMEQLKEGIKAFQKGQDIEKMIDQYQKFDWHIVGGKEWYNFKMAAHSLKGRFRYMGCERLEKKFEKLQCAIQDAHFIQIGFRFEQMLETCKPTHKTLLQFLNLSESELFDYDLTQISKFQFKNHLQYHRLNLNFRQNTITPEKSELMLKYLNDKDQGIALKENTQNSQYQQNQLFCNIF